MIDSVNMMLLSSQNDVDMSRKVIPCSSQIFKFYMHEINVMGAIERAW